VWFVFFHGCRDEKYIHFSELFGKKTNVSHDAFILKTDRKEMA
jgi:hypothetical protein